MRRGIAASSCRRRRRWPRRRARGPGCPPRRRIRRAPSSISRTPRAYFSSAVLSNGLGLKNSPSEWKKPPLSSGSPALARPASAPCARAITGVSASAPTTLAAQPNRSQATPLRFKAETDRGRGSRAREAASGAKVARDPGGVKPRSANAQGGAGPRSSRCVPDLPWTWVALTPPRRVHSFRRRCEGLWNSRPNFPHSTSVSTRGADPTHRRSTGARPGPAGFRPRRVERAQLGTALR